MKLQTEYFWQKWVPLLGPVRALIVMRMRQFGYYNRQTGELRDEVARTYEDIARSIGISTRSLERYFESEPDPSGGAFRVLNDPLLARFIRLRHQYVWRPDKAAPERTTNEYKISMDEPLTPDDEAALRLAAARRLRHGKPEDGHSGRLGRAVGSAPASVRSPYTRQIGGYRAVEEAAENDRSAGDQHTRQSDEYAPLDNRQSGGTERGDALAAQPVVPSRSSLQQQLRAKTRAFPPVKASAATRIDESELDELVATFGAANSRETSPLERGLLAGLVAEVDAAARSAGDTGAHWVAAAIVEAVESGSRYVAPRRIREICRRWAEGDAAPELAREGPRVRGRGKNADARMSEPGSRPRRPASPRLEDTPTSGSEPYGSDGRPGEVTPEPAVSSGDGGPIYDRPADDGPKGDGLTDDSHAERVDVPTFLVDPALGLTNRQLWAAVLDELRRTVSSGAFATWLKPTRLIGLVDPGGALVVGVPNSFAREWLAERFAGPAEAAVETVLGKRRGVRFEVEREWLAGSADRRLTPSRPSTTLT